MKTTPNRGGLIPPDTARRRGPAAKVPTGAEFMHKGFVVATVDCVPAPPTDSRPAEAAYRRGGVYAAHGDFAGAIAAYDVAIRLDPRHADAYTDRGNCRGALGDLDGAIVDYNAAIALEPRSARAYKNRGNVHYFRKDYSAAIADFDRAIGLNPRYADAYRDRGSSARPRKITPARSPTTTGQSRGSRSVRAYRYRGSARHIQHDFGGAIDDYDTAIRLDPQSCAASRARGSSYYHLGHTDDADRDYARAFALDPAAFVREVVDILADDVQRDPDHYANCEKHLRRNPRDFATLSRRGLMHLLDGRAAKARRDSTSIFLLNPAAKSRLEHLIAEVERRQKPPPFGPHHRRCPRSRGFAGLFRLLSHYAKPLTRICAGLGGRPPRSTRPSGGTVRVGPPEMLGNGDRDGAAARGKPFQWRRCAAGERH